MTFEAKPYNSISYGISGTPTTFSNGKLYAMGGTQLLATVKTMLEDQTTG